MKHISVFYEGQGDLIDITLVSMTSLLYNTKEFIDFYLFDFGIEEIYKKIVQNSLENDFKNFTITWVPVDVKILEGLTGYLGGFGSNECYVRFLSPNIVKDVDKVIFLDSDTIILDDINLLYEQDMENYEIALVPDLGWSKHFLNRIKENKLFSENVVFANAGVMLFNCKEYLKNNSSKKILEIAKKEKDRLLILCEEILAVYYGNNYKRLPQRYNLSDVPNAISEVLDCGIDDNYLKNEWNNIIIQHFAGTFKPWSTSKGYIFYRGRYKDIKNCSLFWFFAQKTSFYTGLQQKYISNILLMAINGINTNTNNAVNNVSINTNNNKHTTKYELFKLPIYKIKIKKDVIKHYLFSFIPIFEKRNDESKGTKRYKVLWLPLFKKKIKVKNY